MWCQQQIHIRWMLKEEKRHLLSEAAGAVVASTVIATFCCFSKDSYIDCRILNKKILKKL